MNIFSNLANVLTGKSNEVDEVELTKDEIEAAAKADRIAFHRAKVRNGPISFKTMTNGQVRRAEKRAADSRQKKAFRGEVKNYFERQKVAALLRSHLQVVGLIPFVDRHESELSDQIVSTAWIVQRYGVEVVTEAGEGTGHVSFRSGDVIDALAKAADFYQRVTGLVVRVPADFVPAISLLEGETA